MLLGKPVKGDDAVGCSSAFRPDSSGLLLSAWPQGSPQLLLCETKVQFQRLLNRKRAYWNTGEAEEGR